jgi:hypothetical protein
MGKKSDKEKSKKDAKKLGKEDKKSAKKGKKANKKTSTVNQEQRLEMIAEAAYYIAEKHGFDPQRVTLDWRQAEQQIDAMLKTKKSK